MNYEILIYEGENNLKNKMVNIFLLFTTYSKTKSKVCQPLIIFVSDKNSHFYRFFPQYSNYD